MSRTYIVYYLCHFRNKYAPFMSDITFYDKVVFVMFTATFYGGDGCINHEKKHILSTKLNRNVC